MKKIILLLAILVPISLFGQAKLRKGYITTQNGDTISCLYQNGEWVLESDTTFVIKIDTVEFTDGTKIYSEPIYRDAGNGMSLDGNSMGLGDTLTTNTEIKGDDHLLRFGTPNSELSSFNVNTQFDQFFTATSGDMIFTIRGIEWNFNGTYFISQNNDTLSTKQDIRDLIELAEPTLPFNFPYTFNPSTVDARPGVGLFRLNNADPSNVTEMYIDYFDEDGVANNNFIAMTDTGSAITIQTDVNNYALYKLTGGYIDAGNYFKCIVTHQSSIGTISGLNTIYIDISNSTGSGGNLYKIDTLFFTDGTYVVGGDTSNSISVRSITVDSANFNDGTSLTSAYVDSARYADIASFALNATGGDSSFYYIEAKDSAILGLLKFDSYVSQDSIARISFNSPIETYSKLEFTIGKAPHSYSRLNLGRNFAELRQRDSTANTTAFIAVSHVPGTDGLVLLDVTTIKQGIKKDKFWIANPSDTLLKVSFDSISGKILHAKFKSVTSDSSQIGVMLLSNELNLDYLPQTGTFKLALKDGIADTTNFIAEQGNLISINGNEISVDTSVINYKEGVTISSTGISSSWRSTALSSDGTYRILIDGGNNEIYLSSDGGDNYAQVGISSLFEYGDISSTGQYITLASDGGRISRSIDYGGTFTNVGNSGNRLTVGVSASGQYQVTGIEGGGIEVSNDYGATWTTTPTNRLWNASAVSGNGQYMLISCDSTYVSSDYGVTFSKVDAPLTGNIVNTYKDASMSYTGKYMIIAGFTIPGYVSISRDYGVTWEEQTTLPPSFWRSVDMSNSGRYMYASKDKVYYSKDYGITWDQYSNVLNTVMAIGVDSVGRMGIFGVSISDALDFRLYDSLILGKKVENFIANSISLISLPQIGKYSLALKSGLIDTTSTASFKKITIGGYEIRFNESVGMFEMRTGQDSVIWQGALEDLEQVYNNTSDTIKNGTPFYFGMSIGDSIATIGLSSANTPTALAFQGLITMDIPPNNWGYGCTRGDVHGVPTDHLSLMGAVFLSNDSTTTNTKVDITGEVIVVGGCLKVHPTNGIIRVSPSLALKRLPITKSYNWSNQSINAGTYYEAGFYETTTTDVTLGTLAATETFGVSDNGYEAHPWVVAGGAGTTDAGVVGLTITGTATFDDGTIEPGHIDTLITDITSVSTDDYFEGEKFNGTVTYAFVTISGSPTTASLTFNRGYAKYDDMWNQDFYIIGLECTWRGGQTDATGFDIELLHHTNTGWTYAATGFIPGNGAIATRSIDQAGFLGVTLGSVGSWKRDNLNTFITGDNGGGLMFRITTGANSTIQNTNMHFNGILD
jgi:hypothetical protein